MTGLQRYELQTEIAEIFNAGAAKLHKDPIEFDRLYIADTGGLSTMLLINKSKASDILGDIRDRAERLYRLIRDGHVVEYFRPSTLLIHWHRLAPVEV